jgi:hypothetical protein
LPFVSEISDLKTELDVFCYAGLRHGQRTMPDSARGSACP